MLGRTGHVRTERGLKIEEGEWRVECARSVGKRKSSGGKGKQSKVRRRATRPGPKPSITAAVVRRVAKRYGLGIPLQEALAAEGNPTINLETWKKALAAHPELSPPYDAAKGKFLEFAMVKLRDSRNLKFLCFLLRTRRPDLFAEPAAVSVNVSQQTTIAGLGEDVLERLRAAARENAKGTDAG